ncbi:hypothetical protein LPJ61_003420 [Coemansia biformis]|uniref:DUF3533 domain-containing protein n=1 Tax=Coemansia biformis TaxID=1286918 RepID=A0A9W7YC74_9FUNG|nr:hypothetical protein LPJ61_003420 [Coemansia biformis]
MLDIYSWRHLPGKDDGRVGFADPRLRPELKRRLRHYAELAVICTLLIWAGLSLFLGAMYKRSVMAHNLNIHVIDLDGGSVGASIAQMVLSAKPTPTEPTWQRGPRLRSLDEVKAWVLRHGWGALVINDGATRRLEDTLLGGAGYDPTGAMTIIHSSGRHVISEMLFVSPALAATAQRVSRQYALDLVTAFQRQRPQPQTNYAALAHPVGFTSVDVAPAGFSIAPIMSTFGFLLVIFCTVGVLIPWKMTTFPFFAKVRYRDLVPMWFALLLCLALILSLYQALAFVAFRGPDYTKLALRYTAASFFKLWFTSAGVAFAVGLWLFSLFLPLTPSTMALPSVITVVTNVVSTVTVVELAPTFYRIFYALPFYNGSAIALRVVTGAHREAGREAGILGGEIAAMTVVLALSVWARQICVLRGVSDPLGWYRGQSYFNTPISYYKSDAAAAAAVPAGHARRPDDDEEGQADPRAAHAPEERSAQPRYPASSVRIVDYAGDNARLTTGNLGG